MHFRTTALAAAVIVGAGLPTVLAQSFGNISTSCQNSFLNLVSDNGAASCLNANGLVSAAGKTGANDSIVQPVTDWVTGFCSASPCSNSTLEKIVDEIFSGCSTDLQSAGFSTSSDSTSSIVSAVQQGFPTVRKVLCLKDTDANKLCITEDLSAIEKALGQTLSITNIIASASNISILAKLPKEDVCSNCNKAAYTIIKQDFPSLVSSYDSTVSGYCSSDFVNGETPSSIQQTAAQSSTSGSSSSGNNGAISFSGIMGVMGASVATMVSALVVLA